MKSHRLTASTDNIDSSLDTISALQALPAILAFGRITRLAFMTRFNIVVHNILSRISFEGSLLHVSAC